MVEIIHKFILDNIIAIAVIVAFAILLLRLLFKDKELNLLSREAMSFREILEFSPEPFFVWLYDKKKKPHPLASRKLSIILGLEKGRNTDFKEVLEKIENPEKLSLSFENLQRDSDRFVVDVKLKGKDRYFLCDGNKIVTFSGDELALIIWFKDITDKYISVQKNKEDMETLENEKTYFEKIINSLPFPLWVRNDGQLISDCNNNYVKVVEADNKDDVKQNHIELGQHDDVQEIRALAVKAGREQTLQQKVFPIIIGSNLRNVEINETVIDTDKTLGWARVIGHAEQNLEEIIAKQKDYEKTASSAPVGVLILDEKLNIKYYNNRFIKLWQIKDDMMASVVTYDDLMVQLHKLRKLPEQDNFKTFKDAEKEIYTNLKEKFADNIHISDTVAVKRRIIPMEDGGTITYLEDISPYQKSMRDFYTLSENYRITLENIKSPIAIFGDDGRLKMTNDAFTNLWGLENEEIEQLLMAEVLDFKRPYFDKKYNWLDVKAEMLTHFSSSSTQALTMERNDNRIVDCYSIRLIDGSVMLYYEIRK